MTNPEQTAKRWIELFDKKDMRGLMALYSENCVNAQPHLPQPIKGKKATEEDLGGFLKAFPDARFIANQTVVSGDTIAMEWTFTGSQTGPLAGPGGTDSAERQACHAQRRGVLPPRRPGPDRRRTGIFRSGQLPDATWRDASADVIRCGLRA